jgi:hypothetical protein
MVQEMLLSESVIIQHYGNAAPITSLISSVGQHDNLHQKVGIRYTRAREMQQKRLEHF